MFGFAKKSALLIDFDNVMGMTGGDFAVRIAHWMAWLEAGGFDPARKKRRFVSKRVYWNGMNERYRPPFEAAGFEAYACRAIAKEKKSSADIVITLDAMEIAGAFNGLKEIILLTSDTDFVPVVNRLQDRGLDVVAMGNEDNTSAAVYREYADHIVLRRDLVNAFTYAPPSRGLFTPRPKRVEPVAATAAPRQAQDSGATSPPTKLDVAGDRLVRAAKGALGAPLSKQAVRRALQGLQGFTTQGREPWLGFGSYKALLRAVAAARRLELRLHTYRNGGVSIAYRAQE